jgi:hypothetical protein
MGRVWAISGNTRLVTDGPSQEDVSTLIDKAEDFWGARARTILCSVVVCLQTSRSDCSADCDG